MSRRLLAAALALGTTSPIVLAQEGRPAVRIIAVRVNDEPTARSQMPDPVMPPVPASGFGAAPQPASGPAIPPPNIPAPPAFTAAPAPAVAPPPAGVTVGPAAPLPADGGLFPMPQPDAPLFAPGSPFTLPNPNTTPQKFWVSAEYIFWRMQGSALPPLVTTGPAASNGILGNPGTAILLGNGNLHPDFESGGRFAAGYWFGNSQCFGIEVGGFFLGKSTEDFNANSSEYPLLARPFTNLNAGVPFSELTAYPGLATGSINARLDSSLWGLDTNFVRRLGCITPCFRVDALLGFRYINFSESLSITEDFARTPGSPTSIGVPTAASGTIYDNFSTKNQFYGGQIGLQSELHRGRWFIESYAKLGLGDMNENVTINGNQAIQMTNGTVTHANGGLLALSNANIGSYSQNKFAVVPETGLNLGYNFTPRLRAYVGYNFLYMSSVLRAGNQIDTGLDVTKIPNYPVAATPLTTARPAVPFTTTGMYVQGVNFGIKYSW